jgi:methanogen homocitrate synthase
MENINFADQRLEEQPWKGKNHWVSHFNFAPEITEKFNKPAKIIVHDSTLRDGEQAPGVSFSKEQKISIAKKLDEIGVQYIEAGFPAVSKEDQEAIAAISSLGLKAKTTCLTRAIEKDVDLAAEVGVWGSIIEVPVGYPRLKYQFNWEEQEVMKRTMNALEYANKKGLKTILFLIDAARARAGFLKEFLTTADESGLVDKISVVDTLGAATPEALSLLVRTVKKWVKAPLEVHFHNDFGLATINTISGLMAGAESFSCTVNGLGQRAGNAPLEEVVFALKLLYGVDSDLKLEKIRDLSDYIQDLSGIKMPPYKAVVGDKIFNWEAGIPTAALRRLPLTVEPYTPELVGEKHEIILGKKAGKANILYKLEEFNLDYDDELVEKLVQVVKEKAIQKNEPLSDQEFKDLYTSQKG